MSFKYHTHQLQEQWSCHAANTVHQLNDLAGQCKAQRSRWVAGQLCGMHIEAARSQLNTHILQPISIFSPMTVVMGLTMVGHLRQGGCSGAHANTSCSTWSTHSSSHSPTCAKHLLRALKAISWRCPHTWFAQIISLECDLKQD